MTDIRVSSVLYSMGTALEKHLLSGKDKFDDSKELTFSKGSEEHVQTQKTQFLEEVLQITGNMIIDNSDRKLEILETGIMDRIFDAVIVSIFIIFSKNIDLGVTKDIWDT